MTAAWLDRMAAWRAAMAAESVASVASAADTVVTPENPHESAIVADVATVATVADGEAERWGCASALPPPRLLMQAPHPASIPTSEAIRAAVATWPGEVRDAFEERAAIMKFCGGERREVAERAAYADVWSGWR